MAVAGLFVLLYVVWPAPLVDAADAAAQEPVLNRGRRAVDRTTAPVASVAPFAACHPGRGRLDQPRGVRARRGGRARARCGSWRGARRRAAAARAGSGPPSPATSMPACCRRSPVRRRRCTSSRCWPAWPWSMRSTGGGVACASPGLRLKWPNDILIGQAKCARHPAESTSSGAAPSVTAVIGIGLNLAWHPTDLGRAGDDLAAHGVRRSPGGDAGRWRAAMQRWLDVWEGGAGFAQRARGLAGARRRRSGETLQRSIPGGERIDGHASLGLDAGRALLLRDRAGPAAHASPSAM